MTLTVKTTNNRQITIDLEERRRYWQEFYSQHDIEIEDFGELHLAPNQVKLIEEKMKKGFDLLILIPQGLNDKIDELHKKLTKNWDYGNTYFWVPRGDGSRDYGQGKNFPKKIITLHRPKDKSYLLLTKDTAEVDEIWKGIPAKVLREDLKEVGECGMTIAEYLVFQRDYLLRQSKDPQSPAHPDIKQRAWLLDSTLESGETFESYFALAGRLGFGAIPSLWAHPKRGARLGVVLAPLDS